MLIIIEHTCHSSQRAEQRSLAADAPYGEGGGLGAGKGEWNLLAADTYPVTPRNLSSQQGSLTQFAWPFS